MHDCLEWENVSWECRGLYACFSTRSCVSLCSPWPGFPALPWCYHGRITQTDLAFCAHLCNLHCGGIGSRYYILILICTLPVILVSTIYCIDFHFKCGNRKKRSFNWSVIHRSIQLHCCIKTFVRLQSSCQHSPMETLYFDRLIP